jgi:hypothetical protein
MTVHRRPRPVADPSATGRGASVGLEHRLDQLGIGVRVDQAGLGVDQHGALGGQGQGPRAADDRRDPRGPGDDRGVAGRAALFSDERGDPGRVEPRGVCRG